MISTHHHFQWSQLIVTLGVVNFKVKGSNQINDYNQEKAMSFNIFPLNDNNQLNRN